MFNCNIDDNIFELVEQFNRLGLKTIYSCEGHGENKSYIIFDCDKFIVYNNWKLRKFIWNKEDYIFKINRLYNILKEFNVRRSIWLTHFNKIKFS